MALFFRIFLNLISSVFVDLKIFSHDTLGVNMEVLKLLFIHSWIFMKFVLNNKTEGFPWFSGDWFSNFILLYFPEIKSKCVSGLGIIFCPDTLVWT